MKNFTNSKRLKGFTLIELLVAMSITIVLLGVLVYLTGISMDTYRDSRNEVRASRQAKEALETISKDLESMVSRRDGNPYEWFYAGREPRGLEGPSGQEITNASQLIFFTGATDRYNGQIGTADDKGGDVSAVGYRLVYRDQISNSDDEQFAVFSLYRHLVNPDEAFDLLAVEDLKAESAGVFNDGNDLTAENFLVENIYEFTLTLLVEYTPANSTISKIERITIRQNGSNSYSEFRLKGNKIEVQGGPGGSDADAIANGRIIGAEVSITVLSDRGLTLAKNTGLPRSELIKKHGYHFTKTITTPRP
ncbi:MAG: type II secretion system protein J [Akkermansiaceae bacterium]